MGPAQPSGPSVRVTRAVPSSTSDGTGIESGEQTSPDVADLRPVVALADRKESRQLLLVARDCRRCDGVLPVAVIKLHSFSITPRVRIPLFPRVVTTMQKCRAEQREFDRSSCSLTWFSFSHSFKSPTPSSRMTLLSEWSTDLLCSVWSGGCG